MRAAALMAVAAAALAAERASQLPQDLHLAPSCTSKGNQHAGRGTRLCGRVAKALCGRKRRLWGIYIDDAKTDSSTRGFPCPERAAGWERRRAATACPLGPMGGCPQHYWHHSNAR